MPAQNEIQEFVLPCLFSDLQEGSAALSFSSAATSAFAYNDNQAAIQTAIEASTAIGTGNALVTLGADRITVEFVNARGNTDLGEGIVVSCTFKIAAAGLSVTNQQNGAADVAVTPSNTTTTNAVTPANEVQQIDLNGCTTSFTLNGNSTSSGVSIGLSDSETEGYIQSACDSIWGAGQTNVTNIGSGQFSIEFGGTLAATDVAEMTISGAGDGLPGVSTPTAGVAGVAQVDTCTFSGTATAGSMLFDGQALAYNANASGLSLSGATASGTPASGSIVTTWSDYSSHTPVTVTQDTLATAGQPQIVRVQTTESPDTGSLNVTINGVTSADFGYDNPTASAISGWTAGGTAGNWTYTANANASNVTASAAEGSSPLRKGVTLTPATVQNGIPAGAPAAAVYNTLLVRPIGR